MEGQEIFSKEECEKFGPVMWGLEGVIDITAAGIVPSGTASNLVP